MAIGIIRHGNKENVEKVFQCPDCWCQFKAGYKNYYAQTETGNTAPSVQYFCECPKCGMAAPELIESIIMKGVDHMYTLVPATPDEEASILRFYDSMADKAKADLLFSLWDRKLISERDYVTELQRITGMRITLN